jgi:hypothetical protein
MCRKKIQLIKDAIEEHHGVIAVAARSLNMTRQALYQRINRNKELKEHLTSIRDATLDLAESILIKNIQAGDNVAILFYLKCQGKSRGYIERQEIEVSNKDIKIKLPDDLKDDE